MTPYASLTKAVAAIGSTVKSVLITGSETLSANLTVPATMEVTFTKGATITLGDYNLVINGPLNAGRHQIFNANGAGAVSGLTEAYPEWWGVNTTPGTTDMSAELLAACESLPANGGKVILSSGTYLISSTINPTKKVLIVGNGTGVTNTDSGATIILKAATMTEEVLDLSVAGSTMEHIQVKGTTGNTGDGILIRAGRITLNDVFVHAMGTDGIRIGTDAGDENCNLWRLDNVKSKNNGGYGLKISEGSGGLADANAGTGTHLDIQANGTGGVYLGNTQLSTFVGLVSQSNTGRGLELSADASYNNFFGGDIESNSGDEINIAAGATENNFFGTLITGSVTDGGTNTLMVGIRGVAIGNGIKIGNKASTDLNTLDSYVEADFSSTVAIVGTTDAGTGTYTTKQAHYTRIGNRVFFNITLIWSAHTGTGNMKITGLPVAAAGSGKGRTSFIPTLDSYDYGAGTPALYLADDATELVLYLMATGAGLSAVALDTAGSLYVSGSYVGA